MAGHSRDFPTDPAQVSYRDFALGMAQAEACAEGSADGQLHEVQPLHIHRAQPDSVPRLGAVRAGQSEVSSSRSQRQEPEVSREQQVLGREQVAAEAPQVWPSGEAEEDLLWKLAIAGWSWQKLTHLPFASSLQKSGRGETCRRWLLCY